MQRCPYIHEMKERLLGQPTEQQMVMEPLTKHIQDTPPTRSPVHRDPPIGTVVRLNADGYGSHTSPTHQCTPLVPHESEDDFYYTDYTRTGPKNAKTSLFIVMSFIYAKLLVVICIAYVISDGITHNLPLYYYEGFFTYLYGMSIFFLLYVFCFLLPDFGCCYVDTEKKPPKEKKIKPTKEEKKKKEKEEKENKKKEAKEAKDKKDGKSKGEKDQKDQKEKEKNKDKENEKKKKHQFQKQKNTYRPNTEFIVDSNLNTASTTTAVGSNEIVSSSIVDHSTIAVVSNNSNDNDIVHIDNDNDHGDDEHDSAIRVIIRSQDNVDLEAAVVTSRPMRKRKPTQHDNSHGSFFLRIGAIAFGLGTMIYNGLELGTEFEVPMTSPCYEILRVVNPILQMLFTFMQMYFIFLNSRVNILRFKVIARFGLMHICATNLCVWIRTLVLEYLKEITTYHQKHPPNPNDGLFAESIRQHTLLNAGKILGIERGGYATYEAAHPLLSSSSLPTSTVSSTTSLARTLRSTARSIASYAARSYTTSTTTTTTTTLAPPTTPSTPSTTEFRSTATPFNLRSLFSSTTFTPSITTPSTAIPTTPSTILPTTPSTRFPFTTPTTTLAPTTTEWAPAVETTIGNYFDSVYNSFQSKIPEVWKPQNESTNYFNDLIPAALISNSNETSVVSVMTPIVQNCNRTNIMGNFVQDSTPYLYPFIIEYSLIGAAVIYVMWKNIGRNPRYVSEEDLEHRLEVMLSRRAVAMAHAQHGRVDCVGASKGLFFGLLLLVGSLICLILFFVLIHHPELGLLAIYLADVSHCALMGLSIIAIIIGFIRVQHLKFRSEEQSDLNDILLRVSAFGLFTYAVFSVIAGSLNALTSEPNLLVMVTGVLSIVQVILQLLFVADVARRRVHLPEHDRSKPGRQIVTFLLICNVTMWIIYTFEMQKVEANPVQLDFYGFATWAIIQRITLPLCIFHRFHSAVTLAEIWKTSYKARLE
ncbi:proton channel OtopLc isoform X2 [Chrysoperla carnea]|uniref:proton channel OtopLc isoform X2 n=1 Tax=Chrysoperla carnea TaxID=189513 RepID=UPI001D0679F2|nr:proton channel OtopLc isoform X2 [Chrysoperla carnea]